MSLPLLYFLPSSPKTDEIYISSSAVCSLRQKEIAHRFLDLKDFPNNTLFKIETTLHSENDLMKLITIITSQTKILHTQVFENEVIKRDLRILNA